MNKIIIVILLVVSLFQLGFSQKESSESFIIVHFVYGSKPGKGYKKSELKWFGGIHGGHVKVQTTNYLDGFNPTSGFHIFSQKKNIIGGFVNEDLPNKILKTTSFQIPVSKEKHDSLERLIESYLKKSPYDYAFFGMRCASAAYDLLAHIGIFKERSNCGIIYGIFYPKLLRTKIFELIETMNVNVLRSQGKKSRKWEKDKKKYEYPYPNVLISKDSLR